MLCKQEFVRASRTTDSDIDNGKVMRAWSFSVLLVGGRADAHVCTTPNRLHLSDTWPGQYDATSSEVRGLWIIPATVITNSNLF